MISDGVPTGHRHGDCKCDDHPILDGPTKNRSVREEAHLPNDIHRHPITADKASLPMANPKDSSLRTTGMRDDRLARCFPTDKILECLLRGGPVLIPPHPEDLGVGVAWRRNDLDDDGIRDATRPTDMRDSPMLEEDTGEVGEPIKWWWRAQIDGVKYIKTVADVT